MIRQRLARFIVRRAGYRMVGEVPDTGILVGAPHTSNWDFVTMLLVMWHDGAHPRVLVKKQLFRGPLGWILRRLAESRSIATTPAGRRARAGSPQRRAVPTDHRGRGHAYERRLLEVRVPTDLPRHGAADHLGVLRPADQDDGLRADVPPVRRRQGRHGHDPRVLRRQARHQAQERDRAAAPRRVGSVAPDPQDPRPAARASGTYPWRTRCGWSPTGR